jgi:Fe-S oxidoreductase
MAHLTLIPTIKKEFKNDDIIVANGTSCRHQISDFADQKPQHVSQLLFKIFETVN